MNVRFIWCLCEVYETSMKCMYDVKVILVCCWCHINVLQKGECDANKIWMWSLHDINVMHLWVFSTFMWCKCDVCVTSLMLMLLQCHVAMQCWCDMNVMSMGCLCNVLLCHYNNCVMFVWCKCDVLWYKSYSIEKLM
jgi:hypothetical protein